MDRTSEVTRTSWRRTLRRAVRIARQRRWTAWVAWGIGLAWTAWRRAGAPRLAMTFMAGAVTGLAVATCVTPPRTVLVPAPPGPPVVVPGPPAPPVVVPGPPVPPIPPSPPVPAPRSWLAPPAG